MGVTEQRMEQLGSTLQQTDWRGKGAVEAVLAGDMLYISAHYPVDENGTPVMSAVWALKLTKPPHTRPRACAG